MKPNCVIHCRVSTPKQAQHGESLPVQEQFCRDLAARNDWELAHAPWLEAFSGRKCRPMFEEILQFLDRNPRRVQFYIFRSIDRFTRGGSYAYEKMKRELAIRGVEMIDGNGVIQATRNTLDDVGFEYDWSRFSPSEITETVLANAAKAEVNAILTRMIGQEIRLTQRGYKIRGPQDGFRNAKIYVEGKRRTVQEPDPDRAHFIVTMFAMRAAGNHTDEQIVDHVTALGFRTPRFHRWDQGHQRIIGTGGGVPLSAKRLQQIIRRPIYCGVVWEKWTNWLPIPAAYEGLVSIDTYNAANRGKRFIYRDASGSLQLIHDFNPALVGKRTTRKNPLFPFKNVIMCPSCRNPFMGSASRSRSGKRVPAYHCSRGHTRVGINKLAFETTVETYIQNLQFTPDAADLIETEILQKYRAEREKFLGAASRVGRNVSDLMAEQAATVAAFRAATSPVMRRELQRDVERLDMEISVASGARNSLEITDHDIATYIAEVHRILEHPHELILNPANMQQNEQCYRLVFGDLPTIEEIQSGTAKLSPIFRISDASLSEEDRLVRLFNLSWNTIEKLITEWLRAAGTYFYLNHPTDQKIPPPKEDGG